MMDARTYNIAGGAGLALIWCAFVYMLTANAALPVMPFVVDELESVLSLFDAATFWKSYAALFAIMNPLVVIPMFVAITAGKDAEQRNRITWATTATVMIALLIAAVLGREILGFFAISIGAFRVAGGLIVLSMGLAMLKGDLGTSPGTGATDEASRAVVPLAIPLLAGPGAIATIIVQCEGAAAACDYVTLAAVILAMVFTTWAILRVALPVARFLGQTGLTITTRLVGMVVSAIAVDMAIIGVKLLFPSFA